MLLATTAIEKTWGKNEPILFLGEWCRLYQRRKVWILRNSVVSPFHWDSRKKLESDEGALRKLKEELLIALAKQLNNIHGIKGSIEYWRVILSPWLVSYVAVIWDRWENVRVALDGYHSLTTYALPGYCRPNPPNNFNDYIALIESDEWNHYLFLDVIVKLGHNKVSVIDVPEEQCNQILKNNYKKKRSYNFKKYLLNIIDKLSIFLARKNSYLIIHSYFSAWFQFQLMLRLRNFPTLSISLFGDLANHNVMPFDFELRSKNSLDLQSKDSFKNFLVKRIFMDIPKAYLEDFLTIRAKVLKLEIKPKVIATANAHWWDEGFKVWSAEQKEIKKPLIIMEHGGSILAKFDNMEFEDDIADIRTTWCRTWLAEQVRLPPNKPLIRFNKPQNKAKFCTLIGFESPRYVYRAMASPHAGQCLVGFEKNCALYDLIDPAVKSIFRIKTYQDMGWSQDLRYRDRLNKNVIYENKNLKMAIKESKLLICTYPNTTFSEAMYSGVPTLLYYPPDLWETKSDFDELLALLRESKILFDCPYQISNHINHIWKDTYAWWLSEEVQNVRNLFFKYCLVNTTDSIGEWVNFFRNIKS